jgi:hypothetical protein
VTIKSYVGFVADFPQDYADGPPGKELADHIYSILVNAGINTETPEEREGWAWEFDSKRSDMTVHSIVGFVGDIESTPPRQWLITNDCSVPFMKRIFGGSTILRKRDEALRDICMAIHEAIAADERFSHIVWYNPKTFDQPDDIPGNAPL